MLPPEDLSVHPFDASPVMRALYVRTSDLDAAYAALSDPSASVRCEATKRIPLTDLETLVDLVNDPDKSVSYNAACRLVTTYEGAVRLLEADFFEGMLYAYHKLVRSPIFNTELLLMLIRKEAVWDTPNFGVQWVMEPNTLRYVNDQCITEMLKVALKVAPGSLKYIFRSLEKASKKLSSDHIDYLCQGTYLDQTTVCLAMKICDDLQAIEKLAQAHPGKMVMEQLGASTKRLIRKR